MTTTISLDSRWTMKWLQSYWDRGIYPHSKLCLEGDLRKAFTRGLCSRHREQWRYLNDPKTKQRYEVRLLQARGKRRENPWWIAWRKEVDTRKAEREAGKLYPNPSLTLEERRFRMAAYECGKRKKNNYKWLLTLEEFENLCDKPCTYCKGVLGCVVFGKGLDRIDHKKDYTVDNVLPCCRTCNRIRGDDISVKEARSMINHLLSLRSSNGASNSKASAIA